MTILTLVAVAIWLIHVAVQAGLAASHTPPPPPPAQVEAKPPVVQKQDEECKDCKKPVTVTTKSYIVR